MDNLPEEQKLMVLSFMEITACQNLDTAIQFLQVTNWNLEEGIQLFYVGDGDASAMGSAPVQNTNHSVEQAIPTANHVVGQGLVDDGVRAPIPVIKDTLYGEPAYVRLQPSSVVAFRDFEEESRNPVVWESDQSGSSTSNGSRDNLALLYRPPFALMYQGPFEKAKVEASLEDKWLLVNLQSTEEFSSHMLNRDTWSNEAVAQMIRTNFIFWQVYHDTSEGKKVCTYYNLVSVPAILLIDPITGQKLRGWSGMVHPERLLEELLPFMDKGPKEHYVSLPQKRPRQTVQAIQPEAAGVATGNGSAEENGEEYLRAVAASLKDSKDSLTPTTNDVESESEKDSGLGEVWKPEYPSLPDEPKGGKELISRVGIRLPDGRRLQRSFLRADPVKLLWSFCSSQVEGGETRPFSFTRAIPGTSKQILDYNSNLTFEEAGLSGTMISMTWD